MTLKQKVYNHFINVVTDKIQSLQIVLTDLKESGAQETKSSAGDKHETALAMLQIEQENIRGQLQDAFDKKAALEKINPLITSTKIKNGSLIKTNRGYLFISVALRKALIDDIVFTPLSPQSPLGIKLMGLMITDFAVINHNNYIIESIE